MKPGEWIELPKENPIRVAQEICDSLNKFGEYPPPETEEQMDQLNTRELEQRREYALQIFTALAPNMRSTGYKKLWRKSKKTAHKLVMWGREVRTQ